MTICVWEVRSQKLVTRLEGHTGTVVSQHLFTYIVHAIVRGYAFIMVRSIRLRYILYPRIAHAGLNFPEPLLPGRMAMQKRGYRPTYSWCASVWSFKATVV